MQTSLGGSLIPAAIGVLAMFMLGRTPHRSAAAIVLMAWTVVGYLGFTDVGLSRSASRLVSDGREAITSIVASLWRASLALGAGMAVVVAVLVALFGDAVGAGRQNALWLLTIVPVVSALQFPVIGLLEAKGSFHKLAAQRIGNALCTYMVPALLVVVNDSLVWVSIVLLVGYRICALIWLWRITNVPLSGVWEAFRSAGGGGPDRGSVRRVAPWVAASSLIGSFYLYVDRGLLAISGPRVDVWVTYVAISELMLKTYLIPTATLSVAFPWLIGNFKRRRVLIKQLFAIWAPIVTLGLAASGTVIAWLSAPVVLKLLGASSDVLKPMSAVLAIVVASTIVNWSSQAYVALLQAIDRQRMVTVMQAVLILPFTCAAIWSFGQFGVVGLSAVWALSVLVIWVLLVRRTVAELKSGVSQPTREGIEDGSHSDFA